MSRSVNPVHGRLAAILVLGVMYNAYKTTKGDKWQLKAARRLIVKAARLRVSVRGSRR